MDHVSSLALLAGIYVVSLVSPGPNFIIVTNTSLSVSRTAGLSAGLGLAAASLTWAVLTMSGLGFLLTHFSWMRMALQVAGALYLIWLGVKMIRTATEPLQRQGSPGLTRRAAMRRAYVVSMTNPKALAFFGSIFALAIPAHAPPWFYAAVALCCFTLSATWYCGLAVFFSNPRVAGFFLRFKAAIDRVMGAALILLGGRLLWSR